MSRDAGYMISCVISESPPFLRPTAAGESARGAVQGAAIVCFLLRNKKKLLVGAQISSTFTAGLSLLSNHLLELVHGRQVRS